MSRLFIDVDDTLVIWDYSDPGLSDQYRPNAVVIQFARRWKQFHHDGKIIVWSLGGFDYAGEWKQKLLPFADDHLGKGPKMRIEEGDMFIDDDPLPWYRHLTIHPDMLRELPNG